MKRIIYIAGPMRGRPGHNFPAFNAAGARFRALGWDVVSPVTIGQDLFGNDPNVPGGDYLRADVRALTTCDAIAVLPEWDHSTGARCEVAVAVTTGLAFYDAETGHAIPTPERVVIAGGYDKPAGPVRCECAAASTEAERDALLAALREQGCPSWGRQPSGVISGCGRCVACRAEDIVLMAALAATEARP